MSLLVCAFGLHVLWACGYGSAFGIEGFSRASDLNPITNTLADHGRHLDKIEINAIERSLIEARQAQCQSTRKEFFTQRLADLNQEYSSITKHNFQIPDCKDIE